MNQAVYGAVADVRSYPSLGVTRITIEIPVEHHVPATELLYGKRALVTLAPATLAKLPYGVMVSNHEQEAVPNVTKDEPRAGAPAGKSAPAEEKGGPLSRLAAMWCKSDDFWAWLNYAHPLAGGVEYDEPLARSFILRQCNIDSRRVLDHDNYSKTVFERSIRGPFMAWTATRSNPF